ncbi:hypothetical protein AAFN88_12840 [Pelagibius sp. CAU 1746]|uniref:hypothetical protein n=1 Tax=Pelagibius sp. CAU 1746 TaxID=3140370 RepID=UPI00325C1351
MFNLCSFGREGAEEEAAQEALGLTPDQQNALTKDERTRFIAGLRQMTPEQRAAALKELQAAYGDQAGAVMADLVEAGLPLNDSLTGDPGAGPEVSGRLAQAGESQGEAKTPEGDVVEERAEKLIAEGREVFGRQGEGQEPLEDMEFSLPSSRPKPNPLREDESVEGRLQIPKLEGTSREQVQILMNRMGISGSAPRGAINDRVLEVLKEFSQIRYIIREEGLAGSERLGRVIADMMSEGWGRGLRDTFGAELRRLGKSVVKSPYKHPWSLTDIELTSSIGALGERLRESANQSVGLELLSALVELFAPVGRVKQVAGLALNAIGLSDSIETAESHRVFTDLVNEAIHRKIIVVDSRAIKGAGL